jgi:hypothetical protein
MALFLTLLDRFKNHIFYERKRMKKHAPFLTDVRKHFSRMSALSEARATKERVLHLRECDEYIFLH